jgi:molecular chaperone HscB
MSELDYFSVLGLPPAFDIDLADLEKRYFLVQREFHPDRMLGKSAHERYLAISRSMLINSAYETLKSPLKRAKYLLSLNGIKEDSIKPSETLLMEIMETRETLAEAETGEKIAALEATNTREKEHILAQMANAFADKNLPLAAELVIRLSYAVKISDEIRTKKVLITAKQD